MKSSTGAQSELQRPATADSRAGSAAIDLRGSLEDIVGELAEQAKRKPAKEKRNKQNNDYGIRQMQRTFLDLCRFHMAPIVRYMKAISGGIVSKDLVEVINLIVTPVVSKTKKVGLDQHADKLTAFTKELAQIRRSKSTRITQEQVTQLQQSYWPVHGLYQLEQRGHTIAVANLLAFYRKLRKISAVSEQDIRKLFSIGIPSLTMLRKSSVDELASFSGIPQERIRELRRLAREFQLTWYFD